MAGNRRVLDDSNSDNVSDKALRLALIGGLALTLFSIVYMLARGSLRLYDKEADLEDIIAYGLSELLRSVYPAISDGLDANLNDSFYILLNLAVIYFTERNVEQRSGHIHQRFPFLEVEDSDEDEPEPLNLDEVDISQLGFDDSSENRQAVRPETNNPFEQKLIDAGYDLTTLKIPAEFLDIAGRIKYKPAGLGAPGTHNTTHSLEEHTAQRILDETGLDPFNRQAVSCIVYDLDFHAVIERWVDKQVAKAEKRKLTERPGQMESLRQSQGFFDQQLKRGKPRKLSENESRLRCGMSKTVG